MSVEVWKAIFDWAAVVLVGFTFIAGAGALISGKVLSDRQSVLIASKDRQAALDSKAKDLQIAALTDRATKAERDIASADKNAAEANANAEAFKADIAKANESAEQARAQVAGATAEAATAKLETEKLKSVVTWRTLPPANATVMENVLAAKPGGVNLRYTDGDPESLFLAIQISRILEKAGWKIAPGSIKFANAIQWGIAIPDSGGTDAQTLRSAFSKGGIPFSTGPLPPEAMSFSSSIAGAPTLMIGSRPPVVP